MKKVILILTIFIFINNILLSQNAGTALDFDGDNDRVTTPVDINPNVVPNLTMSTWVYPTNYGGGGHGGHNNRRQVLTHDNSGYDRALLMENDYWAVFTGGCWNTSASVDLNTWQHIAVTYSTTNIKFYKNGVEYTFGSAGSCGYSDNNLWIGDNPDFDEDFPGIIDEVRIWSTALNKTMIQDWMNKPIDSSHPEWSNLLAYWEFNEGSGQIVTDSSPNNNDGYLGNDSTGYDIEDPTWIVSTAPIYTIPAPSNVIINVTNDTLYIQWDSVPEATSYNLYSSSDPYEDTANWSSEQSGITDTCWSKSLSIVLMQKKFYFVTAVDAAIKILGEHK